MQLPPTHGRAITHPSTPSILLTSRPSLIGGDQLIDGDIIVGVCGGMFQGDHTGPAYRIGVASAMAIFVPVSNLPGSTWMVVTFAPKWATQI